MTAPETSAILAAIAGVRGEVGDVRQDVRDLRRESDADHLAVRQDQREIRGDLAALGARVALIETRDEAEAGRIAARTRRCREWAAASAAGVGAAGALVGILVAFNVIA